MLDKAQRIRNARLRKSADSFTAWKHRPVYVVQCYTSSVAHRLGFFPHTGYRSLPGHRDAWVKTIREMIALSIRMERLSQRIKEA